MTTKQQLGEVVASHSAHLQRGIFRRIVLWQRAHTMHTMYSALQVQNAQGAKRVMETLIQTGAIRDKRLPGKQILSITSFYIEFLQNIKRI